ncbi:uncharacterized protein LOC124159278 [Ischnura elegans]|uniref:uncharacterized protein LOC124159278 n=1 Tax=Ischnura elegans TaxID=197161 RepID=UPI001ED88708|nr:uncharacterized protein LOC124159278 [Ischnura elegans]
MSLPQFDFVRSLPMKQMIIPDTFLPTLGLGSLYKTGDQATIEGFRSSLGECHRRKRGGLMQSPFCSKPGFLPGVKRQRRLRSYEIPPTSNTDTVRRKEIEDFFETFQYHREQSKDCFGILHPLQYYQKEEYLYQDPPSLTSLYMLYPHRYVGYRQPAIAEHDFRSKLVPSSMTPYKHLAGRTSRQKDTAWIR